jgi:hypothetical protein
MIVNIEATNILLLLLRLNERKEKMRREKIKCYEDNEMTNEKYEMIQIACKKSNHQCKMLRKWAYSDTLKTVKAAREK